MQYFSDVNHVLFAESTVAILEEQFAKWNKEKQNVVEHVLMSFVEMSSCIIIEGGGAEDTLDPSGGEFPTYLVVNIADK